MEIRVGLAELQGRLVSLSHVSSVSSTRGQIRLIASGGDISTENDPEHSLSVLGIKGEDASNLQSEWIQLRKDCCNTPAGRKKPQARMSILIGPDQDTLGILLIMSHPCGIEAFTLQIFLDEARANDPTQGWRTQVEHEYSCDPPVKFKPLLFTWGLKAKHKLPVDSLVGYIVRANCLVASCCVTDRQVSAEVAVL